MLSFSVFVLLPSSGFVVKTLCPETKTHSPGLLGLLSKFYFCFSECARHCLSPPCCAFARHVSICSSVVKVSNRRVGRFGGKVTCTKERNSNHSPITLPRPLLVFYAHYPSTVLFQKLCFLYIYSFFYHDLHLLVFKFSVSFLRIVFIVNIIVQKNTAEVL